MSIKVGLKAKFFHPRTFGVMCHGEVLAVDDDNKLVKVKFNHPWPGTYWTYMDHIPEKSR